MVVTRACFACITPARTDPYHIATVPHVRNEGRPRVQSLVITIVDLGPTIDYLGGTSPLVGIPYDPPHCARLPEMRKLGWRHSSPARGCCLKSRIC